MVMGAIAAVLGHLRFDLTLYRDWSQDEAAIRTRIEEGSSSSGEGLSASRAAA